MKAPAEDRIGSRLAFLVFAVSCGAPRPGSEIVTEVRGDTTIVITPAGAAVPTMTIDEEEVVWRSDSLAFPLAVAKVGDRLVVSDRDRLHYLTSEGQYVRSVGRGGEGPEEFGLIWGLDARNDTLFVYDTRLNRMAFYDPAGVFLGSSAELPHPEFSGIEAPRRVRLHANGYAYGANPGTVHTNGPMRAAIVWHELGGDSTAVAGPWFRVEFASVAGMLVEPNPLGPSACMAVGRGGRWAYGDGVEYCFVISGWDTAAITRVCREWDAPAVTREVRAPDFDEIWDVFSPDGRLVRTIRLPATFEPRLILDGVVWGLLTMPVGDRALARVRPVDASGRSP